MLIFIRVIPRARESRFDGMVGDRLKLRITAPPVDGSANDEIIRFLSKYFTIPKNKIHIKFGLKNRDKTILIDYEDTHIRKILSEIS